MEQPLIPVSIGELIDKWVILSIKASRIMDQTKVDHVMTELETLNDIISPYLYGHEYLPLQGLVTGLTKVNEELWDIEDEIRDLEREGMPQTIIKRLECEDRYYDMDFTGNTNKMIRFVELARAVYVTNDKRCAIKRQINELLNSGFLEEKSYKEY